MIPDSYLYAILFGSWLRPEDMELRWDVAKDYLSACNRRGVAPSVWDADDFLQARGRWRYDQKTSPKAGAP